MKQPDEVYGEDVKKRLDMYRLVHEVAHKMREEQAQEKEGK